MTTVPECDWTLLVQAEFDGELDAGRVASLLQHRAACPQCTKVYEELGRSRNLLRAANRYTATDDLRQALQRRLPSAVQAVAGSPQGHQGVRARRRFPAIRLAAALATVAIAALLLFMGPRTQTDTASLIVDSHLRALQMDNHLVDVLSSDRHTVRPWFAGRINFAPFVRDLGPTGYEIVGGRVDVIGGNDAAVIVYKAGKHIVDVFMLQQASGIDLERSTVSRSGFHIRHWNEGGLDLWCISDLGDTELDTFVERWRAAGRLPAR